MATDTDIPLVTIAENAASEVGLACVPICVYLCVRCVCVCVCVRPCGYVHVCVCRYVSVCACVVHVFVRMCLFLPIYLTLPFTTICFHYRMTTPYPRPFSVPRPQHGGHPAAVRSLTRGAWIGEDEEDGSGSDKVCTPLWLMSLFSPSAN